ncbi:MFS general substrate transporter, partial [Sarocladium strictum]
EGKLGVAGWQWLFIVLAILGSLFAVAAFFLLPDYLHSRTGSAMWTMTENMRRIAEARIIANRTSDIEAKSGIGYGLKLSLADYKLWLIVCINITISAAYAFSNFYPAIFRGFGYDGTTTLVMTFPPYLLAAFTAFAIVWSSGRQADRGWHFSTPIAVGMAAYVVCIITTATVPRYAASYFFIGGLFGANPLINTWINSTLSRSPEKKATSIAVNNVLGQIGNVIAPFFFVDSDEPRYQLAFILMFLMAGLCIASAMALKFSLWRENKRLLRIAMQDGTP